MEGEGIMAGGMKWFSLLARFSPLLLVLGVPSCMMIEPREDDGLGTGVRGAGLGLGFPKRNADEFVSFGSMGEFQKFGNANRHKKRHNFVLGSSLMLL